MSINNCNTYVLDGTTKPVTSFFSSLKIGIMIFMIPVTAAFVTGAIGLLLQMIF